MKVCDGVLTASLTSDTFFSGLGLGRNWRRRAIGKPLLLQVGWKRALLVLLVDYFHGHRRFMGLAVPSLQVVATLSQLLPPLSHRASGELNKIPGPSVSGGMVQWRRGRTLHGRRGVGIFAEGTCVLRRCPVRGAAALDRFSSLSLSLPSRS